jgi:hypothetical protein
MMLIAIGLVVAAVVLLLMICGSFEHSTEREVARAFFFGLFALAAAFFAGLMLP